MSTPVDYKSADMKKPRPRNAAATRDAILASARRSFAEHGYDGAGVREIAAGAGVTAMLVNRYFGSKEQLFEELLAAAMNAPAVMSSGNVQAENAPQTLARSLVDATGGTPLDGFRMIINSASNPGAADLIRTQIEKYHHRLVASSIEGEDAEARAALVLSLIAGFQFMRQMVGLSAFKDASPDTLAALLEPLLGQLMIDPA